VAPHRVPLATLLVQSHPEAPALRNDILDHHAERSANARERIDHEPDQGAVTQTGVCRDIDAVEQRPRFGKIEHRRLPGRHHVPGPPHRRGRVDWHHLAGDEPVKQVTDRQLAA